MAVPHDETVAYHEAGHLVIGRRSGVAVPYEIYLETEHGQLDGHLGARESYDIPEAAQAVVRFLDERYLFYHGILQHSSRPLAGGDRLRPCAGLFSRHPM